MRKNGHVLQTRHCIQAALSAAVAITFLLTFLAIINTQAAPLLSTGHDPKIRLITMTAPLPHYDPANDDGVTKTVYFSNSANGVITMTFEISGTQTLTLTAGAAFAEPRRVYTSSSQAWAQPVTYTVQTTHTSQYNVAYTATNTNGLHTTVAITYVRDVTAPTVPLLIAPVSGTLTNTCAVEFDWSAASDGAGSGVAGYNLKLNGAVYTTTASYTQTGCLADGNYTWTARAYDRAGNYGAYAPPRTLRVGYYYIYLPLTLRNYAPFNNGSFEVGWGTWQHSGELEQSLSQSQTHAGQWAALLGNPGYNNQGGVPAGSGRTWQTFSVPNSSNPRVTIWYRIYTHDVVWGVSTPKYYDSFEIYINTVDWSEANNPAPNDLWRQTRCRDHLGTPDTNSPGLVFCDGNPSDASKLNQPKDLGWRSVTLDLSQFKGQNITLYLATFNRVDGWYNTWTG